MRFPFLVLTPVCVFLGLSTVIAKHAPIDLLMLSLVFIGAICAHISVNMINEYSDFKSGLDFITHKTKFSGGSGALPQHPDVAINVLIMAIIALLIMLLIGLFFILKHGLGILPIGILGALLITTYTHWINRFPMLCLISPGLGFGYLMVVGTQFVLMGHYISLSWLVASIPFLLVNNLLLLNQYPDIKADRKVGRKHFPITYGIEKSNLIYALSVLMSIAIIMISILTDILPTLSMLALLPMPLAFFAFSGAIKYKDSLGDYPQYLAANVFVTLFTPLLLAISLIV